MTKIIGITGAKRHGKGEVAAAVQRLVPGAVEVGFAHKLKVSMARALGFDRSEPELIALMDSFKVGANISILYQEPGTESGGPYADNATLHNLTGRQLLQWYGTEGGRETFGDSFWVDQVLPDPTKLPEYDRIAMERALYALYQDASIVAISDVRFDNEAQRVVDCGGEIWKVVRDGVDDGDAHVSEAGVDQGLITRIIYNNGTLEELQWEVEKALELAGALC